MLIKEYVLNFFIWWYLVRCRYLAGELMSRFVFLLQYTNTLPMAQNLGKPLYQDDSGIGRLLGIVIRGGWVWVGGIVSVVLAIPFSLTFVVNMLLPVAVIFMIVLSVIGL